MSAPLRILQVAQKPQRRGAEVFAAQLAVALRREGCEVATVYLYPHRGSLPLPLGPADVVLGGRETHLAERVAGFHPGLLRSFRRAIAAFDPDVVQANGARTVKYAAFARRLGAPTWALVYRNIADPTRWGTTRQKRWFYRRLVLPSVDAVVGVSHATLAELQSTYALRVPVVQLPRAVDPRALVPSRTRPEVRHELGARGDSPVLLYVGSLTPEKRIDRLLRLAAAARTRVGDLRLWIAGEGSDFAAVRAHPGVVEGWIVALGVREDIGDLVHAADLMVLTSDTEGIPGVLLEAAAGELAVVSTDVGGVRECVRPGQTGLLVDPSDEQALADAVVALLADPARRRAMGERGRAWVDEAFSLERVARGYVEVYEAAVAARRSPAPAP